MDASLPLGPEERARLRPAADVGALERLLERIPPALRVMTLLYFYESPTAREALQALEASGVEDEEVAELRALAEHVPLPPHLAHPENDVDPSWTPPVAWVEFSIDPPDDPELRTLWDAVETQR